MKIVHAVPEKNINIAMVRCNPDSMKLLNPKARKLALEELTKGNIIVVPTDTLYAIAADATSDYAVQKIYNAKKRNINKALPIFVADLNHAEELVSFNNFAYELAKQYWPGPLTLVLPLKKDSDISYLTHQNTNNVAVRIPNCPDLLKLIRGFKKPITGTSANISGNPNTLSIHCIRNELSTHIQYFFEGSNIDMEDLAPSTVIDCTSPIPLVLREGKVKVNPSIKTASNSNK